MLPYKTIISLDRNAAHPLYLQVAEQIILNIEKGILQPGFRLPGSRILASQLEVSRQTIISTYDELHAQGWIEIVPQSGPIIAEKLPLFPSKEKEKAESSTYPSTTGFPFHNANPLRVPLLYPNQFKVSFNDGFPDVRIAPMEDLMRAYRNVSKRAFSYKHLMYHQAEGALNLRQEISQDLHKTRGINASAENMIITKGSQMGIFLTASLMLKPGDTVIVGERNYFAANATFRHFGAKLHFVPVDDKGMDVEAVESICKKEHIKMLYITPHHYHPTTVILSADRREKLLALAVEHHFAILEDDYDYDFHYAGSPVLPMASADKGGNVVYIGSLCKTIAPAIRIGFMVAPAPFIRAATQLRRMLDRQGDTVLEEAVAEIYQDGTIHRHMKKALKLYKSRRDQLTQLLQAKLPDSISFRKPDGGMAIWANFHQGLNLPAIAKKAANEGLLISDGTHYTTHEGHRNGIRLGFASLNFEEMDRATDILEKVVRSEALP